MSFVKKHGNVKLFTFNVPDNFVYKKPADLAAEYGIDTVHKVNALYINNGGRYGESLVIATDNEMVNAPQHLVSVARDVFNDDESVALINNGKVGFELYEYTNQHGNHIGLNWVDL